ncbi:Uncharacterised protein [Nocardia africana]|uniref:Uncharacterized protein n=1 Tax=Nocardia africana TaxID=134964 RepID=A0A379X6Q5_9NOCA|nr:Uncharacterised protein [Nocardia africana]
MDSRAYAGGSLASSAHRVIEVEKDREPQMMRWLPAPRPVLVDPRAVFVLPRRWPAPGETALGVLSGAVDPMLSERWVPALLHRWLRTNLGGLWMGEVEIVLQSRNRMLRVPIRQWINQSAIRIPDDSD